MSFNYVTIWLHKLETINKESYQLLVSQKEKLDLSQDRLRDFLSIVRIIVGQLCVNDKLEIIERLFQPDMFQGMEQFNSKQLKQTMANQMFSVKKTQEFAIQICEQFDIFPGRSLNEKMIQTGDVELLRKYQRPHFSDSYESSAYLTGSIEMVEYV